MYKCKSCGTPLTEYDVAFAQNLSNQIKSGSTVNLHDCKCFECQTKGGISATLREKKRIFSAKYILAHISWLLSIAIMAIIWLLCSSPFFVDFIENLFNNVLGHLFAIVMYFLVLICVFGPWVWGALKVIDTFGIKDTSGSYATGNYIATTNSSGQTELKKEYSYYGSTGAGKKFLLGITFPFWSIFHLLYKFIQVNNKCAKNIPEQALIAFNETEKSIKKVTTISSYDIEKYEQKVAKYKEQIKKTADKYAILGVATLNEKIAELEKPVHYDILDFYAIVGTSIGVSGGYCLIVQKSNDALFGRILRIDSDKNPDFFLYADPQEKFPEDIIKDANEIFEKEAAIKISSVLNDKNTKKAIREKLENIKK